MGAAAGYARGIGRAILRSLRSTSGRDRGSN